MYFLKSLLAVLRFYDLGDKKRRMTQKVKRVILLAERLYKKSYFKACES